ncbi:MAG: carboxypeptidase regulatory-like domain-containing protein [Acidobacteriaceae bacterium]|nr:carboxypeptidase regulatory-like domain-containing protein [Acidobacteriaceae bacterium]
MKLLCGVLFLCAGLRISAQETASISGVVTDPSGALINGVTVNLANTETAESRQTETNSSGYYALLQLPAGTYDVKAEKQGFKVMTQQGIVLAVNQAAAVNLSLKVGDRSEEITVTESAPIVSPTVEATAGFVTGEEVRDLPLNGRSYDQLLTLNPGIVNFTNEKNNATPGISNSAVGNMFAVSGRRPQENLFLLDGIEYTGSAEINMTPGGTSGELLGVDAIREFNVLTDFYNAEYGKRPGAQVLIVDRSGTNDFHGSAYEFLRNSYFDARNFFDQSSVPGFQRNQFGGTLGGPVARNRIFLFGNYEGFRQNLHITTVTLVPDNDARMGILPGGVKVPVSPVSAQLLSLWPVQSPNSPLDSGGIAEAFSSPKQTIREDFGTARFDQIFSRNDTLSASYTADNSFDNTPTANPLSLDIETLFNQVATLRETHVFLPNLVNTATFGFSRASYFYTGRPAVAGVPGFIGDDQVGAVVIGGSATPNTASSITMAGSNNGSHLFATRNLFTYQDQLSIVKDIHQISVGAWFQRVQSNDELALGQYGQATFSNLTTFLLGVVTTFTAVPSPTPLGWRSFEGAWFVQDEMRLSPRFTLSLGFRDEFTNGWNEAHDRASNFIAGPNGVLETQPRIESSVFTVNHARFLPQPRVGLAWDVAGNSKTVVRAGFGLYNDLQDALSYRLDQNAPFNTSISLSKFPLSNFPLIPGQITAKYKIAPAGVQQDLFTPTVISYMLRVEQQLTPNTSLSVGYAGSHGYHETLSADLNQPFPTICPAAPCGTRYHPGTIYYPPGAPLANPALASTWTWISSADSNYNAMLVDFRRRFASGVEFRTAYTWSKSLDDGDTLNASAAANAPGLVQNSQDIRNDWGPSTFDVRQVVAVNGIYELPFGPGKPFLRNTTGFARILAEGWSLNGIFSYNSGFPFTPQLSFNPSNNGNTTNPVRPSLNTAFTGPVILGSPNKYFNPNAFVVPPNGTYGNLGRNTYTGPGLADLDISLVKNTRLTERLTLQLRGEVFNIVNHPNFSTPNLVVYTSAVAPPSGSAGVITSTATSSRQFQVAAKLIW